MVALGFEMPDGMRYGWECWLYSGVRMCVSSRPECAAAGTTKDPTGANRLMDIVPVSPGNVSANYTVLVLGGEKGSTGEWARTHDPLYSAHCSLAGSASSLFIDPEKNQGQICWMFRRRGFSKSGPVTPIGA